MTNESGDREEYRTEGQRPNLSLYDIWYLTHWPDDKTWQDDYNPHPVLVSKQKYHRFDIKISVRNNRLVFGLNSQH